MDKLTYEEVEKKLQGKPTITPVELNELKIFSNSCAIEHYHRGRFKGEYNGKRLYSLDVKSILDYVKKKKEEQEERKLSETPKEDGWVYFRVSRELFDDFFKSAFISKTPIRGMEQFEFWKE